MINCFQFCFNFAFKSNLRRYKPGGGHVAFVHDGSVCVVSVPPSGGVRRCRLKR